MAPMRPPSPTALALTTLLGVACRSAPAPVATDEDGPPPLSLVWFGDVKGELEPCG